MNLFKQVKAAVPAIQAARDHGMRVSRSGMALCPFHDDHHPSLQLGDRYYCHACGASGDVIDLTAKLLGISNYSAANRPPLSLFPPWCMWTRKRPPCTFLLSQSLPTGGSVPRRSWETRRI